MQHQAPLVPQVYCDHLTYDELRDPCRQRHRKVRFEVSTVAVDRERKLGGERAVDSSATLPGEWIRAMVDAAENSEELLSNREKRGRAGDLPSAFVADKEVAKGRAQWRNPNLKARRDATHASVAE